MSANQHRLQDVMTHVARRMLADFDISSFTTHWPSKGSSREEYVRDFLRDYLPGIVEVTGSAELISTDGQVSGQCDVTVVSGSTPRLWSSEAVRAVPVESCYSSIEVKSALSVRDLEAAWRAAVRLKSMPRTAYLPLMGLFDIKDDAGRHVSVAPTCHLFAYSGASLDTLRDTTHRFASEDPYSSLGLDSICVLDQGFIAWREPSGEGVGDRQPGWDVVSCPTDPGDVLLFLVTLLHQEMANAEIRPRLDLSKYVTRRLGLGTETVDGA